MRRISELKPCNFIKRTDLNTYVYIQFVVCSSTNDISTTVISETTQRKQTSLYKLNKIMAGKHTSDSGSGWIGLDTIQYRIVQAGENKLSFNYKLCSL